MIPEFLERVQGYPGLFLLCALSGIAFPLPEDVSLIYAGIQLQQGALNWPATIAVVCVGVMVRDTIAYAIGRFAGDWILRSRWVLRLIGEKKLDRAQRMVDDRGASAVLLGRFLVGVRATVFFASGAMGVPFRKFVLWNAVGLVFTVPPVVVLGHQFGQPLMDGAWWAIRQGRFVTLALFVVIALLLWRRVQNRPDA